MICLISLFLVLFSFANFLTYRCVFSFFFFFFWFLVLYFAGVAEGKEFLNKCRNFQVCEFSQPVKFRRF